MSPTCARDIANPGSCVLSAIVQKYVRFAALVAVVVASLLPGAAVVWAANGPGNNEGRADKGAVTLLTTIPVPVTSLNTTAGAMYSFDISWVDSSTQTYYLADRSNRVVDVVTRAGDPTRADELAYDPRDGLLLVINNVQFPGHPPFATFVKVNKATGALTVGSSIILDAAHGVDAQNGAEQPVWHPATRKFFLSIPQVGSNPKDGAVVRIDPKTAMIDATYPVEHCGPAGLTVGPRNDLLVGCNKVFDTNGNVWDPAGTVSAAPKDVILDVKTGATTDVPA